MAKSTYLNLELTEDNPYVSDWANTINGVGEDENKSNAQLVDEFAGKFAGGTAGQVFVKSQSNNFAGEWKDIDNGGKVAVPASGAVEQEILPDKFYDFTGSITSLTITLGSAIDGRENEYKGQFTTGATAPTVSFPASVSWIGGAFPTMQANKRYQFSILNGIGVIVGV